ncbi:mitoguardin 1-like [Salvelinus alpinus]|uniref:mitoguardin 1-like n=1 Tax=Salvelinus alpinus TaxID=8036 RepID=UPI0039FC2642
MLPEEREVPLVNLYLTTKRVEDIALRLVSLRQAFTTLLGSTLSRNHLFVAGKVLLGALVQANHMDEAKFIRTYNDFVDYLSDPSKRNDIERELAEAKIHHVNMIDVLFELVLFGMMTAQKSLMVHAGGFVEHLYALLYSFLPTAANMEPEADRYLLLLNGGLMALLDDMFGQQLAWYFNPESLVTELSSLLEYHLENIMARM